MEHRVLRHGTLGRVVKDTVSLHVDHLVASSDANHGSANPSGIDVLLDNVIDLLQSFRGHADLFRTSVGQLAGRGCRRIQGGWFVLRFDGGLVGDSLATGGGEKTSGNDYQ